MINRIESLKSTLRRSELKVAELVLARPNIITNLSIADMARQAGVSEPTVLRFCRAVGCSGFQDLKRRLIGDLARTIPAVHRDVNVDDPAADLSAKIFDRTIASLLRVKNQIDAESLDAAIDFLAEAERIEFYGSGASGVVAQDAQNKFFRFGVPSIALVDAHVQAMAAAVLHPGCVVVAISNSGRNADLVENLDIARHTGARLIAITRPNTPVADAAHVVIGVETPEDTQIQTPMTSRLTHLVLLDVLQVGTALRKGPNAAQEMEKAKAGLKGKQVQISQGIEV